MGRDRVLAPRWKHSGARWHIRAARIPPREEPDYYTAARSRRSFDIVDDNVDAFNAIQNLVDNLRSAFGFRHIRLDKLAARLR